MTFDDVEAPLTFRFAVCDILPETWLVQFQKSDGEWMTVTAKGTRPEAETAIATLRDAL